MFEYHSKDYYIHTVWMLGEPNSKVDLHVQSLEENKKAKLLFHDEIISCLNPPGELYKKDSCPANTV